MSIYTARLLKGNQRPSPDFKQRGLEKLQPSSLTNSEIKGFPHKRQIAYSAYVQNLSAFIFATEKNARVSTSADGFPIQLSGDKTLPHNLPSLGVSFSKKITKDTISAWDTEYGVREIKNAGQTIFIFDRATLEIAKNMVSEGANKDSRNPGGVSTLNGLHAYQMLWKIVTLFCATHTYPAFSTPLDDDTTVHNYVSDVEIHLPNNPENVNHKRRKIIPHVVTEDEDMEEEDDLDEITGVTGRAITMRDIVVTAKPAPFYPNVNFGSAASVPSLPGLAFPYFHGLIVPDYQILPRIIWKFFLLSFGSNKESFTKGFKRWRDGVTSWVDSVVGLEMQHMVFGIDLALETQTRIFFVVDHETYHGFVLLGEGFSVVAHDREYRPVSRDELRAELAKISPHDNALSAICKMLSDATIGTSRKRAPVVQSSISSNRALWGEVKKRRFSQEEQEKLLEHVNDLCFPERYWKPSPESLEKLLDVYVNNAGIHPDNAPMYIGSGLLFSQDDAYFALSVFGPTAPSFFTIGGDKIEIPATGKADPLSVLDPDTKKPKMPFIPYTMKSIKTAMQDLYKVYKDRAIYILPKERAGPSRTTQFIGKSRDTVWSSLRQHIGSREDDDDEGKKAQPKASSSKDVIGGISLEYGEDLDFE